jgi:hypothetical protein
MYSVSSSSSSLPLEGAVDDVDGRLPLKDGVVGVWSGWIKVLTRTGKMGNPKESGSGREEKQTRIMRRWRIGIPGSSGLTTKLDSTLNQEEGDGGLEKSEVEQLRIEDERITIVEQTSFDLDKVSFQYPPPQKNNTCDFILKSIRAVLPHPPTE